MPSDKYGHILESVLKTIKPKKSDEERLKALALKVLEVAGEEATKVGAKSMLVGSLTRDTWLPDKAEFDVFILFRPDLPREELQKEGLRIGKAVTKRLKGSFQISYAEHPYVSGKINGMDVDIVPCYEIGCASELKSAVDRTPFHVRYIEKRLPLEKSSEVRLLKQFCKAQGVYGADAETEGFSGYVCELLIIKYGGFLPALRAAADWRAGQVIDIDQLYDSKEYPKLRRQFKDQAMILIDPVDKTRNAAAAVSANGMYVFRKEAIHFLAHPGKNHFFSARQKPLSAAELKRLQKARGTELILIRFKSPDVVPDIFWPQLRRFAERLESILEENEFNIVRRDVHVDGKGVASVLVEMDTCSLPIVQKRVGPRVFDWDDSRRFVEKYKSAINGPFVENNFWAVEIKRRFLTAHDKLADSLGDKVDILKAKGIPSHVAEQISKRKGGFAIIHDAGRIAAMLKRDKELGIFLRRYFEKESLA